MNGFNNICQRLEKFRLLNLKVSFHNAVLQVQKRSVEPSKARLSSVLDCPFYPCFA